MSELHARGDRTVTSDRRVRRVIRVVLLLLLVASAGGSYGVAANYRGQAKAEVRAQPAAVPVGESSRTAQWAGSTPSSSAALRYGSGWGLPRG